MSVDFENRWNRWHADGWTGLVIKTKTGDWLYDVWQGDRPQREMKRARGLADAQHQAEEIVRASGHRCVARCSFWVPETPEEF